MCYPYFLFVGASTCPALLLAFGSEPPAVILIPRGGRLALMATKVARKSFQDIAETIFGQNKERSVYVKQGPRLD